ncbi:MAG: glycoside hydrolase family 88 protein [Paludibacter sp.]|nr:glycoside hydrolase family 88 protein [Paludibacter sp.]
MNKKTLYSIAFTMLLSMAVHVSAANAKDIKWLKTAIERSEEQLSAAAEKYKSKRESPRTFEKDKVIFAGSNDWTCGFFPGSLWYLYEITKNDLFKAEAAQYTEFFEAAQYRKNTHDVGFILNCSYGNGYRITGNPEYKKVLVTGANSLMTRFHPQTGLIKSWDNRKNWQYPVIIDNMMNLELLCRVTEFTHDPSYIQASISHADKTLENHFRPDNSCYHVVNYDSISGKVISKETHQGFSNESSWARGQGWALYGFTMMYRETKDPKYLEQAQKVAQFILHHSNLPIDKIPYWDFNAPNIPNEPRDASAAAIYASALLELSGYMKDGKEFYHAAEQMLMSLSSPEYLAAKGENGLFILKHSTGNLPKKSEIDAPLNYADYYYLEALGRYMKIKGITNKDF